MIHEWQEFLELGGRLVLHFGGSPLNPPCPRVGVPQTTPRVLAWGSPKQPPVSSRGEPPNPPCPRVGSPSNAPKFAVSSRGGPQTRRVLANHSLGSPMALGLGIVEQLSPTVFPNIFVIRGTIETPLLYKPMPLRVAHGHHLRLHRRMSFNQVYDFLPIQMIGA